jgi:glucose-1-phosphate adenylyltransferase
MQMLDPDVYRAITAAEHPVRAKEDDEAPTYIAPESRCVNSMIADGCTIEGSVENSILFPGVHVEKGASVKNCVLFKHSHVEENASVSYIIADKYVRIRRGSTLTGHENYPMAISKHTVI